jgi:FkbH-like protein
MIEGWPLGIAEAAGYLKKRGILLAIISKNDERRVREIFPMIYRDRLLIDDFVTVKINWRSKSENMAEILSTMSLLPRNVLFVDDNPSERSAMQAAFPDMRIIGRHPYYLRRILLWSSETDVASVTDESGRRTEMMQRQFDREFHKKSLPREDFLRDAAPRVEILEIPDVGHSRFPRILELVNKTNQFNTTGKRWKIEEFGEFFRDGGRIFSFSVSDKFTDYGLVGVVLVRQAHILQWVMSCRVLGYDIENAVMATLVSSIRNGTETPITADLVETDANFPCRSLFSGCSFEESDEIWILPGDSAPACPPHVSLSVR